MNRAHFWALMTAANLAIGLAGNTPSLYLAAFFGGVLAEIVL